MNLRAQVTRTLTSAIRSCSRGLPVLKDFPASGHETAFKKQLVNTLARDLKSRRKRASFLALKASTSTELA